MSNKEEVPYSLPLIYRFGQGRVARRFGIILSLTAREILKPDTQLVQYLRDLNGVYIIETSSIMYFSNRNYFIKCVIYYFPTCIYYLQWQTNGCMKEARNFIDLVHWRIKRRTKWTSGTEKESFLIVTKDT